MIRVALAALLLCCLAQGDEPRPAEPSARATDLSYLTRACLRCHGVQGPNRRLYDERGKLLANVSRERLRGTVPLGLTPGGLYEAKTEAEKADLRKALAILKENRR